MSRSQSTLDQLRDRQPSARCQPSPETVIRFVCVRPAHVASAIPGVVVSFVTHHGTCGYCPGQAGGHHEWTDTHGVTAAALLRGSGG